jgi:hypothetical protein
MVPCEVTPGEPPGVRVLAAGSGAVVTAPRVLGALLLVAFVTTPYLPMVDLPEHASEVAVWLHLDDPSFAGAHRFTVNLATPYLTAYVAARLLAAVLGVVPALKMVVWASVVLHQIAFSRLVRQLRHPAWLGLLGLPLGLGYPFYFGFVSFVAAIPLVLLTIGFALEQREDPTWQRGALLAGALAATLATHGFALGVALFFVAPLLLRGGGRSVPRLAPLAAPALLWAVWLFPAHSIRTIGATIWEPRFLELLQAPALWFGASAKDAAALAFGYGVLVLLGAAIGRPARAPERWAPLALLTVAFCSFPLMLSGFGPLHPRFAAFFVPALLLAFEPRETPRSPRLPLFALALSAAWFVLLSLRLVSFTRETRPIRDFVTAMPEHLRVRPIVFERASEAFPGLPALLHLSAYYMVEKGGFQGYSFAMYPTSVIRYADGVTPGMGGGAEWHPEWFSADAELSSYDCFLVHSTTDRGASLFGPRAEEVTLDFHEDAWWAYRVRLDRALAISRGVPGSRP